MIVLRLYLRNAKCCSQPPKAISQMEAKSKRPMMAWAVLSCGGDYQRVYLIRCDVFVCFVFYKTAYLVRGHGNPDSHPSSDDC